MPELTVTIGGRAFSVSCQEGEETFLRAAARALDAEAQPLVAAMGRLPEARMLLMAGLMLADRLTAQESEIAGLRARLSEAENRPATERPVPVPPPGLAEGLAELAARAEALAERLEESA